MHSRTFTFSSPVVVEKQLFGGVVWMTGCAIVLYGLTGTSDNCIRWGRQPVGGSQLYSINSGSTWDSPPGSDTYLSYAIYGSLGDYGYPPNKAISPTPTNAATNIRLSYPSLTWGAG